MNVIIKREFDYAIRICAYLSGNYDSGPISLSKIAEKLFITRPFATKIVHKLKKSNIIATVQGKEGGVFLNQIPNELSIFSILLAMGFDSTINECIKHPRLCPLVATCKIHQFFSEQEKIMIKAYKTKMISEFAFTDKELRWTVNVQIRQ